MRKLAEVSLAAMASVTRQTRPCPISAKLEDGRTISGTTETIYVKDIRQTVLGPVDFGFAVLLPTRWMIA